MKIVIVDDDCLVTEALKTILEVNEDVQVLATGSDGRDAVCLYAEYKPDVLLMDIRMKNMRLITRSLCSRKTVCRRRMKSLKNIRRK